MPRNAAHQSGSNEGLKPPLTRRIKRLLRSGKDIEKLLSIVEELAEERKLPPEYHDHPLSGKYENKRDCHIEPDWILIYAIEDDELVLYRTGSHSQLFR